MAENKITNQLRYTGMGPVDIKLNPVRTVSELPNPFKAYNGQVVTVLDDNGESVDYTFNNGMWQPKQYMKDVDGGSF